MGTNDRRQEIYQTYDEDQLHEEILRAFNEYYKANLHWKTKKTIKSCVKTRVLLSEIRHLCNQRRKLLNEWRHDPESDKWKVNTPYSYIEKSKSQGLEEEE